MVLLEFSSRAVEDVVHVETLHTTVTAVDHYNPLHL